jgi:uncharacterized protein YhfF
MSRDAVERSDAAGRRDADERGDEAPHTLLGLPVTAFAFPGPLRDRLTALVLAGTKTATAGLVVDHVIEDSPIPRAGDREVVIDSDLRPVAIIETTRCQLATIGTVSDEFARDEGEGFADAAEWRVAHERFWSAYLDDLRRDLRDPEFALTSSTLVVCQWFRLVSRVDPATGEPIL